MHCLPPRRSALNVSLQTLALLLAAGVFAVLGCSSGPSRVQPPSIDADDAASEAMELYDKDGDGAIAGAELDAAGSLKASMAMLDVDKDGKVQEEEIVKRIESWQSSSVGLTNITARVTLDGRPLVDATVTFEPEPFLGEGVKTAVGTTTSGGVANVSIPKADRPDPDWPPGIQYGFFKVRVSKQGNGSETLPAKFNAETVLGQEIAFDDPEVMSQLVKIDMTSN